MAEANPVPAHGATPGQPPASFAEIVDVPAAGYRTAIAIKGIEGKRLTYRQSH